ncbi:hypothetical protein [Ornithinimicrobium kibberense]|uniref:hypothetical protein n=1 Tax=Ornithinimicrobium kibberense TaxID=282060 RepID=UPI0036125CCB
MACHSGKCRLSRAKQMQMKNSSSHRPTALTPTKNRPNSLGVWIGGQFWYAPELMK